MVETVYICSGMCKVQIILEEAGLAGRRGEGVDAGASGRYSLIVGCSGAHVGRRRCRRPRAISSRREVAMITNAISVRSRRPRSWPSNAPAKPRTPEMAAPCDLSTGGAGGRSRDTSLYRTERRRPGLKADRCRRTPLDDWAGRGVPERDASRRAEAGGARPPRLALPAPPPACRRTEWRGAGMRGDAHAVERNARAAPSQHFT